MLYMREDDMDEMLRKAAENYEVDAARASDWDAVHAAIHDAEPSKPVEEKKKKRRFVFWWLLLIPVGWIANTEFNKFHTASNNPKQNETAATKAVDESKQQITKKPSASEFVLPDNNVNEKNIKISLKDITAKTNQKITQTNKSLIAESSSSIDQSLTQNPQQNIAESQNSFSNKQENVNTNIANNQSAINNLQSNSNADQTKKDQQTLSNEAAATSSNSNSKNQASANKNNNKNNSHYFYAGLVAGADLSFVKFQQAEPLGYNLGILAGYKFNKLSIESGLLIAKKNYYTSGEYFDKSNIPYFYNADLTSVNGYCKMFEIPLDIKYDFISRKKHVWFATTGLSSYLMNKEYYDYSYVKDGVQHEGSYPYYHTTQDWFSVLNISAGYQLQTGSKTDLRIEPYYKTTLNGVGTGNLSISSAGINIGITRRIP